MKIIYIGSAGPLSVIPLTELIKSKHSLCAIAFDDDLVSDFNVTTSNSIQSLALKNSIPLVKLDKYYVTALEELQSYQADIILVSCYSRLLPHSILSLAKKGCFNLHPSLLPAFRGPNPVFWQFREGINNFGITLHRISTEYDTGNILSQKKLAMPDGINKNEATVLLANAASELMLTTLDDIQNNHTAEYEQESNNASYQSFPEISDYRVSVLWEAKHIYNFICAIEVPGTLFPCEIDGYIYYLIHAYSYQTKPYDGMDNITILVKDETIFFACQDGYVCCQIKLG